MNTESSELGGTITGKEVLQLQLNGRNFTQLITLVPGVSNQTGQDEGQVGAAANVNYSVNGGRTEYNNWEVDGGDMMDNGSNFSLNVYPSVEAIGEVQVLTSNYGAQYGRNGSGTVEVETKSGTNAFHGSVWEFAAERGFQCPQLFRPTGNARSRLPQTRFRLQRGRPDLEEPHVLLLVTELAPRGRSFQLLQLRSIDGEPAGKFQRSMCTSKPQSHRLPHRSKYRKSVSE